MANIVPLIKNGIVFNCVVDSEDYDIVKSYKWCINGKGYAYCYKLRNYMHRVILNVTKGYVIDHINDNKLDNRKANLRICSNKDNISRQNKRIGTSKYKGVSWCSSRNKWQAQIKHDYKQISLGRHDSEIEAAKAYDNQASKLFGQFVRLNFPCQPQ